ncbi:MAG: hypothetical protein ABJC19_06435 [Gemmatimonadota bacterium]
MRPFSLFLLGALAAPASAQTPWQAGDSIGLIRRAVSHRTRRDADTLLAAWQATARGVVRFASEVDHGSGPVERIIRADELLVEVYGEAPNRSKQTIVAWRDTSFLPNRVNYHRDHLGIVANDFGELIRLGDGEEVRDVLHPLTARGLERYQFRLGDTTVIVMGAQRLRVVAVDVRPADPAQPAAVGTLYLDADRAALVRFRFTFTPASYRDATVEGITVTLDNALLENAAWLPWRQSIVIRRGSSWLDLPIRTILRADWSIENYVLGGPHPDARFRGAPIAGLTRPTHDSAWATPLVERLDALPATDADVAAAEADAMRALGGHLLDGLPAARLAAHGVSDIVRVNRVQGVTPFLGFRLAPGGGLTLRLLAGIGSADHRMVGRVAVERAIGGVVGTLRAERMIEDIGGVPTISGALNSLRTAISGVDLGDYVRRDRVTLGIRLPIGGARAEFDIGVERSRSVATVFTGLNGRSDPNPPLGLGRATTLHGRLGQHDQSGNGWTVSAEVGSSRVRDWLRIDLAVRGTHQLGLGALQWHAMGGLGTSELPAERSFLLGGRSTLPGVAYRSIGGSRAAWADLAWLLPVALPTPRVPRTPHVRLPSAVGPFVAAGVAGGSVAAPWQATGRVEPVAGLRLDLWGPLLRLEAGVSMRTGRVGVTLDVHPDWWPVL